MVTYTELQKISTGDIKNGKYMIEMQEKVKEVSRRQWTQCIPLV